jgi:hypothetical protein
MIKIGQSTIERLAWLAVFLILIMNIIILAKLTIDDDRKFQVLRSNQNQLLCIIRESTNPVHTTIDPKTLKFTVDNSYIDRCIKAN